MLLAVLNTLANFGEMLHRPFISPPKPRKSHLGNTTTAYGPDLQLAQLQYVVVELDSLISSDDNRFPQELQPRNRNRAASKLQVNKLASKLNPVGLLEEFHSLDRGTPIIDRDLHVLSGNGRIMALRQSERYDLYRYHLARYARNYGITREITWLKKPVLVRVLVNDTTDLVSFCKMANSAVVAMMATTETAKSEATNIKLNTGELVDKNLVIGNFLNNLPDNISGSLIDPEGQLNQDGQKRFESALFYQIYQQDNLVSMAYESLDPDIKNITKGMAETLLEIGQIEQMVSNGERNHNCSIGKDIGAAVNKFVVLRHDNIKVSDYLSQIAMFEDELTETQKLILSELPEIRSKKQMIEFLTRWVEIVRNQPDPRQVTMFEFEPASKISLVNRWLT